MDAISDRAFTETNSTTAQNIHKVIDETPSLLTVILDLHPLEWKSYTANNENISFRDVTSAMLVMLNSHLALNSGNRVSVYIANSFHHGAKLVYPEVDEIKKERLDQVEAKRQRTYLQNGDGNDGDNDNEKLKGLGENKQRLLKSLGLYGQFKVIDARILEILQELFEIEPDRLKEIISKDKDFIKGTMIGAISTALTAINKLQTEEDTLNMKARIMVISVSGDNTLPYVSMMNTIFAAQKMKVSIDVCKLGQSSIFLQQTSDATNGVYIDIKHPSGLIQYLSNALFIEPMLRPLIVLPTNTTIDFRASCFVTNQVVDIGYVCSVCLCIISMVPNDEMCPTCHSKFDHKLITKLKRKPKVLPLEVKKKKKQA
ncbi:RNA polymerase II transcription factor B subunit 4 [Pichia kudriavzevii]|uniref:General transcription and DNA repair factor IIH subunit TFB4 n=1 Tax=Pichia kudriavzevii TaxID=4909 RepID=A0A1V2LU21_PICKU|nr:RNA polymerase II transcription factor B subunit 4 [Pichia kudriavzevii]